MLPNILDTCTCILFMCSVIKLTFAIFLEKLAAYPSHCTLTLTKFSVKLIVKHAESVNLNVLNFYTGKQTHIIYSIPAYHWSLYSF